MTSSSTSRHWLARFWPYLVAGAMVAYVIILFILVKADIERTTSVLRQQ